MLARVTRPRMLSMSYCTSRGARQSSQADCGRLPKLLPHSLQRSSYLVAWTVQELSVIIVSDGLGVLLVCVGRSRQVGDTRYAAMPACRATLAPPNLMCPATAGES